MSYAFDYPVGREVVPEPQEYPFYALHPTATPRFVEYAAERFEWRDPSELDLTSHRKIRDLARGGFYRPYGMTEITGAEAAGVTAYTLVNGMLILLQTPGAEKVESRAPRRDGRPRGSPGRATRHADVVGDAAGGTVATVSTKKPPPWWKTYPRAYWTAGERAAAIKDGWRPPAAERRQSVFEEQRVRVNQHLPQAQPLFTGAMERPEDYERRQRQQRVARLLAKHGIGQRPGPWWRI